MIKCFPELTPRAWHLAKLVQQPGTKDTWLFIGNEKQKNDCDSSRPAWPLQFDLNLIFLLEGHYNSFISESHILPVYDVKKHKTEKASKGKLETSKLASYHFKY